MAELELVISYFICIASITIKVLSKRMATKQTTVVGNQAGPGTYAYTCIIHVNKLVIPKMHAFSSLPQ